MRDYALSEYRSTTGWGGGNDEILDLLSHGRDSRAYREVSTACLKLHCCHLTIPNIFDNASHVSRPLGRQQRDDGIPVCRQAGIPTYRGSIFCILIGNGYTYFC